MAQPGTLCEMAHAFYAIYDAIILEIPYHAQSRPFDLVALDTDLQEHQDSRMKQFRMKAEWVNMRTSSYEKWITTAQISKTIPHSMLSLAERHQTHLDFVKGVDFLGTVYRAYKDLTNMDNVNRLEHLMDHDRIMDQIRKDFKTRNLRPI